MAPRLKRERGCGCRNLAKSFIAFFWFYRNFCFPSRFFKPRWSIAFFSCTRVSHVLCYFKRSAIRGTLNTRPIKSGTTLLVIGLAFVMGAWIEWDGWCLLFVRNWHVCFHFFIISSSPGKEGSSKFWWFSWAPSVHFPRQSPSSNTLHGKFRKAAHFLVNYHYLSNFMGVSRRFLWGDSNGFSMIFPKRWKRLDESFPILTMMVNDWFILLGGELWWSSWT